MRNPKYIKATYYIESDSDSLEIAQDIAYGQSIGNPYIRTPYDEKLDKHLPQYYANGKHITIHYPKKNFSVKDGVNYLLSVLMGGQMDIGRIKACRLVDLDLSPLTKRFPKPRYGVSGIKKLLGVQGRPLFGAIIKPKIGLRPNQMAEVCRELAEGGIDFIKEDEILGEAHYAPLKVRVKVISDALKGFKVLYAPCITADGGRVLTKAETAQKFGATALHLNIWCGFGSYLHLREYTHLPIFFQKSGDRILTTGPYSIESWILYKLIYLIGCDFAHVGMFGGYLSESVGEIKRRIEAMGSVIPSFSCGAHPGVVGKLRHLFGDDIMITSGGAIHGHPLGVQAGAKAFRQALNGYTNPPLELREAIKLWGVVS